MSTDESRDRAEADVAPVGDAGHAAPEPPREVADQARQAAPADRPAAEELPPADDQPDRASDAAGGEEPAGEGSAEEAAAEGSGEPEQEKQWYILKVQSNRENSIAEALQRRIAVEGLDEYFGEVVVPTEMVTEFKGGKKKVVKRKLYPGYIVAHMVINEDTWFLVRETPGIGDFTGAAGKPTPMAPHEVARIITKKDEKTAEAPKLKINFSIGDRVKINEGTFDNFEGDVSSIDEASGRVTVMINIFGRSTPVELEYWQVESL